MLKKLNPNFAILLSTILWGTWWLPLRLMNEYADNNAIPLFLSFMIAGVILLVFSIRNIHLFTKKNIILTIVAAAFGAAAMCLYNEGLLRGNVARILIFFYLTAVWSTIIEIIFLKTPLTIYLLQQDSLVYLLLPDLIKEISFHNLLPIFLELFLAYCGQSVQP